MAVYRESAPRWRTRLPLIVAGIGIAIVLIVGLFVLTRPRAESPADTKTAAARALDTIAQSLDLFDIEYAKVVKGTSPAQTGAPGALSRAAEALAGSRAAFDTLNAGAAAKLSADLSAFDAALKSAAPPDLTAAISDANAQVATLRAAAL